MAARADYVIAAEAASADAVDLGRKFGAIVIRCVDTDGIDTATTMSANVGMESDDTLAALWLEGGVGAWQSGTLTATDNGTFQFILPAAMGVRRVQPVLSKNTESAKPVTLTIYGLEPMDD